MSSVRFFKISSYLKYRAIRGYGPKDRNHVEIVFPRGVRLFMTEHLHQHKHIHVIKGTSRSIGVTEVVIAEFYTRFRFDFLCPVFHGIDRQQLPVVLSVNEVTTCKPFL